MSKFPQVHLRLQPMQDPHLGVSHLNTVINNEKTNKKPQTTLFQIELKCRGKSICFYENLKTLLQTHILHMIFDLKKKKKTQPYHYSISSLIRLISLYTFSLHRSHTDAFDPLCCFPLHIFILAKSFLKRGFQNWILYIDKSQIYLFYCNASFFPFITIDWALWSFHSIKHSFLKKKSNWGSSVCTLI